MARRGYDRWDRQAIAAGRRQAGRPADGIDARGPKIAVLPPLRLIALTCAVAALALTGCQRSEADALAAVKARIAQNNGASVEIDLKTLIRRFPDSAEARYLFGRQLQKKGDAGAAEIEFQRAMDLDFQGSLVFPAMAQALLLLGKNRQLIAEFATVTLADAAAMADLQATVANAHAAEGDFDLARQAVDRALAAAPQSEAALLVQARIEATTGNRPAALAVLDRLLVAQPGSPAGWALKGTVLALADDQQDEAIAALRQSLALKSDQIAPRTTLITLYFQRDQIDAATQEVALLQAQAPRQLNTLFYGAQLAYATAEHSRARALYQSILRLLPDNPAVLIGAAKNEIALNALPQAEAMAAKAVALSPTDKAARHVLAQALLRQGQPPKAIATLLPLIDGQNPAADTLALAAEAYGLDGNARAADALYARLDKAHPADPRLRTLLVGARFGKATDERVYRELQAIADDDKGTSADRAIIDARMAAKAFEPALRAIDTLQRKQPDSPTPHRLRAQVLAQQNKLSGARQAFEQALRKAPTDFDSLLGLAALDALDGKPDDATKRLENLLKTQPGRAQALIALAELAASLDKPRAEVTAYLDRAVKADPSDAQAWLALIDHHLRHGALRPALSSAQNALAALPKNIDLLGRLGRLQLRAADTDQALSTYAKIIGLQPRMATGFLGQAEVQTAAGNLPEASRSVDRALEREPRHLAARALAVRLALQQGQLKPALGIARSVQNQRPNEAIGYSLEAEVALRQGQWDTANALLRKALGLAQPGDVPIRLHQMLSQRGHAADAEAMAAAWLKRQPDDRAFLVYLGDAAQQQGQAALAEQRYRAVLAQQADHVVALNNLAMLLARQHQPGAVTMAERALKVAPEQPALLDTLAQALAANNQLDEAVEVQKSAVALAPSMLALRLSLVRLQLQAGDKAGAKANLQRLAAANSRLSADDRHETSVLLHQLTLR